MEALIQPIVQGSVLYDRMKMFTADGMKNQNVCIDGFTSPMCTTTNEKGQIESTLRALDSDMRRLPRSSRSSTGKLTYQVSNQQYNLQATGSSTLIMATWISPALQLVLGENFPCDNDGITFISDVNDTIKYNGESSTIATIVHTFTELFQPIEGMSQRYQQ